MRVISRYLSEKKKLRNGDGYDLDLHTSIGKKN